MNGSKLFLILILGFLWGCDSLNLNKEEYISRVNEPIVRYREETNVNYGRLDYQDFDIYYPENVYGSASEVVILLHGGSWVYGDKWFLQPSVDELKRARKNLTIVNINYSLVAQGVRRTLFEQQMADIDSCVNYLRRNTARYNIRSEKIAIMGASAGGHLALAYAYTLGQSKVHTAIGMSAITELSMPETLASSLWDAITAMTGYKETDATRQALVQASPVHLAGVGAPRTVLLYGMRDTVVGLRQQTLLKERLTALRVPNALYLIAGQDHNVEAEYVAKGVLASLGADEFDLYFRPN